MSPGSHSKLWCKLAHYLAYLSRNLAVLNCQFWCCTKVVFSGTQWFQAVKAGLFYFFSPIELMANKGTQEGQCLSDTADLADSVLDCLSTGMKIIVVFAPVVVLCSFQPFPLCRPRQLYLLVQLLLWLPPSGSPPLRVVPLKFQ